MDLFTCILGIGKFPLEYELAGQRKRGDGEDIGVSSHIKVIYRRKQDDVENTEISHRENNLFKKAGGLKIIC